VAGQQQPKGSNRGVGPLHLLEEGVECAPVKQKVRGEQEQNMHLLAAC